MTPAYDILYLENARSVMATMLDFAVYELKYDLTAFFDMFLKSDIVQRFERGESGIVAGKSGIELAYEVIEEIKGAVERIPVKSVMNRSEEYWTGWALAYYQWETGYSFSYIVERVPIKEIKALYSPYHEMDIRQFVDKMNEFLSRTE